MSLSRLQIGFASTRPGRVGLPVATHTKAWSAKVDDADAFVFVTPESTTTA
jgi:NAD(P)H-dependent FMN reductase